MKKRILYYLFILLLFPHNGTGQTVARMSDRPVNTSQWIYQKLVLYGYASEK